MQTVIYLEYNRTKTNIKQTIHLVTPLYKFSLAINNGNNNIIMFYPLSFLYRKRVKKNLRST